MNNKLWCDLKTDQEKAEFLRSGKACGSGIIAEEIQKEVAEAFQFRADNLNSSRLYKDGL